MNKKIINNLVKEVTAFIENESHCNNHTTYIACNVKLYGNKFYINSEDIRAICKELKLSDAKSKYVNEYFNEDHINNIFQCYLENQANYLQDEFFGKCCINSSEHWNKEIKLLKTEGQNIGIKEMNKKIKKLEKWKAKDQKEGEYIDILKHMGGLAGFFGRSCGWYAVLEANRLDNLIDEIENAICFEDKIYFYKQLKELYNACQWALEIITKMKEGINFREEIEYRIEEALDKEGFIEDSSTINYAIN